MDKITYGSLNFNDPAEVWLAAEVHESAPLNWDTTYVVRKERVQNRCDRLMRAATDETVCVLTAKTAAGEIIGFHWLELSEKYNEKCARILSLWVSESHRRNGIGKDLKRNGEEWAKRQGAKFIVTDVFYANKKMIDFNLKNGFSARQVEMIKDL